jgi:RNA polymerase sigma-70 factor (ECF subfamily)
VPADPEQLIQDAKGGRDQALGDLLDLYRNYLRLLARLEIGHRVQAKLDASDIVQETFLEAHRHFGQFNGKSEGEFVQWLRMILAARVANTLRHYLGTQGRDVRREEAPVLNLDHSSMQIDQFLAASISSPSQQAVRRERAVLLADALEALPKDYREVLTLRHFQGLSFPDVAQAMGRSVDSVQKLWLRALMRLKERVGVVE